MATPTYTDDQLQALKNALANGTLHVRFVDREITYRSVNELKSAIATVDRELSLAAGKLPNRQVKVFTSKGINTGGRI